MKANLKDLIAALPREAGEPVNESNVTEQQMPAIFADLARRRVPTGSLHRLWMMGELSTQIALAYGAWWWMCSTLERRGIGNPSSMRNAAGSPRESSTRA